VSAPSTPLQIPDFRRFIVARFLIVVSTISMVVLIGYQAYDLARSDYGMSEAEAAFQLGLLGLAQFLPILALTPIAGVVADQFDRRNVVACSNVFDAVLAATLAYITWQELLTLPILFALAAAHGGVRSFMGPALSSIAPNIVPAKLLPRAIAVSSVAFTVGNISGPALGGFIFAEHPALPHLLSAIGVLCCAVLVLTVRPVRAKQSDVKRHPLRQIVDGLKFTWKERFLLGCISLDLFAVILAGATALLPVFARDILEVGPEGLGLMRGAPAAGAGIVALWLSFRPIEHNVGAKMLWGVAAFGAATIAFGISRDFYLSLFFLALLGAADMVSVFIRNSLVQLNTPDEMRGRVSSISGLAISASNELGEMQSGIAAAILGATGAVVFGGAGAIVVTALWAWIFPELRWAKTFDSQYLDQKSNSEMEPGK
jgi:MFS family permease